MLFESEFRHYQLRKVFVIKRISYIMMIITILIISSINMACEIGELRELRFNLPYHKGLQLTDNLTDPNRIEHNSQITPIIYHDLLLPMSISQDTSQLSHII